MHNLQKAVETWRLGLIASNKDSLALHQRLAGALVTLKRVEEAGSVLDKLDALIPLQGGVMVAADRAGMECSRDFIRAKWWLIQGNSDKALPLLKSVASQGIESTKTPQSYEAWALLGDIWGMQANGTKRPRPMNKRPCSNLVRRHISIPPAKAWAKTGRYDTAIHYGEQALAIKNALEIRLFLADTRCRQQIRLPKSQRDWQPFRKTFAEAAAAAEKETLAGSLAAEGDPGQRRAGGRDGKTPRRSPPRGRGTAALR